MQDALLDMLLRRCFSLVLNMDGSYQVETNKQSTEIYDNENANFFLLVVFDDFTTHRRKEYQKIL